MIDPKLKKILIIVALAVLVPIAAFGIYLLYTYNPEEVGFFPKCPTKYLTSYDCPGCGSTRALHSLMHGDFAAAWRYHAAIFFAVPILLLLVAVRYLRYDNPVRRFVDGPWTAPFLFIAIVAWGILRNVF